MSEYNYSVVLLIPAAHKDAINELAESLGWGPDNLSIELQGADGTWYGCHTWAAAGFLEQIANTEDSPALSALVVSAVQGGDPLANWNATLSEHNLTRVEVAA